MTNDEDDEVDEDDGYRRLSAYLDAPTVDRDDAPGMDDDPPRRSNEWDAWAGGRGNSTSTVTQHSQSQAVQMELEQLRSGRMDGQQGWNRLQ